MFAVIFVATLRGAVLRFDAALAQNINIYFIG